VFLLYAGSDTKFGWNVFLCSPFWPARVIMTIKLHGKPVSLFVGNGTFFLAMKSSVSKQMAYVYRIEACLLCIRAWKEFKAARPTC
jgi:hypothetical protein